MSNSDLSDLSTAELNERKAQISDDSVGRGTDHIDDELARRESERAREMDLLDMKVKLEQARDAGLADDPTVAAVEERVADLESDLHPDPRSDLATLADVDEAMVAGLSEEEAEQAQTHLEAIDMLAGSSNTAARVSVKEHRDALETLFADRDVEVDVLSASVLPDDDGEGVVVSELFKEK